MLKLIKTAFCQIPAKSEADKILPPTLPRCFLKGAQVSRKELVYLSQHLGYFHFLGP